MNGWIRTNYVPKNVCKLFNEIKKTKQKHLESPSFGYLYIFK